MPSFTADLGMPTLIELPDFSANAALCQRLGLQFVELNANLPLFQPDERGLAGVAKAAERYGVGCTIHLDENCNPFDFCRPVAEAYTQQALSAVRVARRWRFPILVMHLPRGVYFTLPGRRVYLFEQYEERFMESVQRFRERVEEAVGESGVQIALENTGGFPGYLRRAVDALLQSPAFGLCWDVGHDTGAGNADSDFIRARLARVIHFHLHDVRLRESQKWDHLPPGEGEVDWKGILPVVDSCRARCVLEVKTVAGLERAAAWAGRTDLQQS